jgi:hypothetical protein
MDPWLPHLHFHTFQFDKADIAKKMIFSSFKEKKKAGSR